MRKFLSVIVALAILILPLGIFASAEGENSEVVFSLNVVRETEDYVMVSIRLDSGSFNSLDVQFAAVNDNVGDCVYIEESDELYMFFIAAKRSGGAVLSLPYMEPGKYGFATTIAYDHIDEDIIVCKFIKNSPENVTVNDIAVEILSCSDEDNLVKTTVISKLPAIEEGHQHDYVTIVETVPETCCEDGYVKYKCSCGNTYTEIILAHGHSLIHMSSGASCTESSLEFDFCKECSGIFNRVEKDAEGHKWGEWEIAAYPTADKDGAAERKCLNCTETESIVLKSALQNCDIDTTAVSGLKAGMSVDEFKTTCIVKENAAEVVVTPSAGSKIGTGSTVSVIYESGVAVTYDIIIYGDVTGDGWYDGQDALLARFIANGLLNADNLGAAAYAASDCNHDGVTDENDVELLEQAGVLLGEIDQTKTSEDLSTSSVYSEYIELIEQSTVTEEPEAEQEAEAFSILTFLERIFNLIKICFAILRLR